METTNDFILMLQKLDPTGNKPLVISHEGVGFNWCSGELANCAAGIISDGAECVIVSTLD